MSRHRRRWLTWGIDHLPELWLFGVVTPLLIYLLCVDLVGPLLGFHQ